jgi:hypothetical protein
VDNNSIDKYDYLGLRQVACVYEKPQKAKDSGWSYSEFAPKDLISSQTGGHYAPQVTCIYRRTIITNYKCECSPDQTRTIDYYQTADINYSLNLYSPGGALDISGVGLITGILLGAIAPPSVAQSDADAIRRKCNGKLSNVTGAGTIYSDTGHPFVDI